jgi:uncharacterized protein (TIGR03435 family)
MSRHFFAAFWTSALIIALGSPPLRAQAQRGPIFEVASLRLHPPPPRGVVHRLWLPTFQCPPGWKCGILGDRFRELAVSLADLIMDAYKVKKYQIAGLPEWGDSGRDLYDLDAKIGGDDPPRVDEVRLMLQALLTDRFQLRVHHESRPLRVYSLVAAKNGVKLLPNKIPCLAVPGVRDGNAASTSRHRDDDPLPWSFNAELLFTYAGRPIIDETGLDGSGYCAVDGVDPLLAVMVEMADGASLFTAVEEKWGMKLEPKTAPVDVLVIDKVERPSEN